MLRKIDQGVGRWYSKSYPSDDPNITDSKCKKMCTKAHRKDSAGMTNKKDNTNMTADEICKTVKHGTYEEIKRLASNTDQKTKNYALAKAAEYGKTSIVGLLLDFGADIHHEEDYTLRIAAHKGRTGTVKLLLERGACVNASDSAALRWAANSGHLEIVDILIRSGADIPSIRQLTITLQIAIANKMKNSNLSLVNIKDIATILYFLSIIGEVPLNGMSTPLAPPIPPVVSEE